MAKTLKFGSLCLVSCSLPLFTQSALAHSAQPFQSFQSVSHAQMSSAPATTWQNYHRAAAEGTTNFGRWQSHPDVGAAAANVFASRTTLSTPENAATMGRFNQNHRGINLRNGDLPFCPPLNRSGELNLGSAQLQFLAGNLGNFSQIVIDVGGRQETIALNTKLTAAEIVAAQQVLTTGTQTIRLNANGTASGGTIFLNDEMLSALGHSVGGSLSSLTITRGVQVVDSVSSLALPGNFTNYGSLLTASATPGGTDIVSAQSIFNGRGATIASYEAGSSGLYAADPTLVATAALTNNGTISSSGNINISAPVVNNLVVGGSDRTTAISAGEGVIRAGQNVNIDAGVINSNGVVSAVDGNINVASAADISVHGGDYLSQQLNFSAPNGQVVAYMDRVTGLVGSVAGAAHIYAATDVLKLGCNSLTGDPTFANTAGDITLSGAITAGESIAILASQNINIDAANTNAVDITAGAAAANITLIAGAKLTNTGTNTAVLPGMPIGLSKTVTVDFSSGTGGNIDLVTNNKSGAGILTTGGNIAGGVNVYARAGNASTGNVALYAIVVGAAAAQSDDVTIIAGGTGSKAINIGYITTNGFNGGHGNVFISGAQPTGKITFNSIGIPTSGSVKAGPSTNTGLFCGSFTTNGGNVTINTAGDVDIPNSSVSPLSSTNPGGSSGNLSIRGNNIALSGTLRMYGTDGSDALPVGPPSQPGVAGGNGGNGGNITIVSTGNVDISGIVRLFGGLGGKASDGTDAVSSDANGGFGGAGGNGGHAGTLSISSTGGNINISADIQGYGGNGGQGGLGGAGFVGGDGGAGGRGGIGGSAGSVNISTTGAGVITVDNKLTLYGGDGGIGGKGHFGASAGKGTGGAGGAGGAGGQAGNGGNLSLSGENGTAGTAVKIGSLVSATIVTDGGQGGDGGDAENGASGYLGKGGIGGVGGIGGISGNAGSITIITKAVGQAQSGGIVSTKASTIQSNASGGGDGGDGGIAGQSGGSGASGAVGGSGGAAGLPGKSALMKITTAGGLIDIAPLTITLSSNLTSSDGGIGGAGGNAISLAATAGVGGRGGNGGKAVAGGTINISAGSGLINLGVLSVDAGNAGDARDGGAGGTTTNAMTASGNKGGVGGTGGAGAAGGVVTITGDLQSLSSISAKGSAFTGNGGDGGAGSKGTGGSKGQNGSGANGGLAGAAGVGGKITYTQVKGGTKSLTVTGTIDASATTNVGLSGRGGAAGNGNLGGVGGNGADGAKAAKGGNVTINAVNSVTLNTVLALGSGVNNATGAGGGSGGTLAGGKGGAAGTSGDGGSVNVVIKNAGGSVLSVGNVDVSGGLNKSFGGTGGAGGSDLGGNGLAKNVGVAGATGGSAGLTGKGGTISLTASDPLSAVAVGTLTADGGAFIGKAGRGGDGGDGVSSAGGGGTGGAVGKTGMGGSITVISGTTITGTTLSAAGGAGVAAVAGDGGVGGQATNSTSATGGLGGAGGSGGAGGKIALTAGTKAIVTGILAGGGTVNGGGTGGAGGLAFTGIAAGVGGRGGTGGVSGNGGTVTIKVGNATNLGDTTIGSINTDSGKFGGFGGSGGAGGAGPTNGNGGTGGAGGVGGMSGNGGTITVTTNKNMTIGGATSNGGDAGGDGGFGGAGGTGGALSGNGGTGGLAGAGGRSGNGGKITLTSTAADGVITNNASVISASGGGLGGLGGNGGSGGVAVVGLPGANGGGGDGGDAGNGGMLSIKTGSSGSIRLFSNTVKASGGQGGDGGFSNSLGGKGGKGGKVSLSPLPAGVVINVMNGPNGSDN